MMISRRRIQHHHTHLLGHHHHHHHTTHNPGCNWSAISQRTRRRSSSNSSIFTSAGCGCVYKAELLAQHPSTQPTSSSNQRLEQRVVPSSPQQSIKTMAEKYIRTSLLFEHLVDGASIASFGSCVVPESGSYNGF